MCIISSCLKKNISVQRSTAILPAVLQDLMLSIESMCSAGHALHTVFRLKKQALLDKELRKPPRVNNEKDFFLRKKKDKCQQQGVQTDPKAAAGPGLWGAAWKTRVLHRNFKFHQAPQTQHHTEPTTNKVPPSLSEHPVISISSVFAKPRDFTIMIWV